MENVEPAWTDHHYLNFWLWACLHDAEAYLAASGKLRSILVAQRPVPDMKTFHQERMEAQKRMDLEKYHFITTMGSLLRNLKRSERLFPSIQSAYRNAQHLLTEGKQLRDMVEHAEEYLAGEGRNQSAFLREAEGAATNLPGSSPAGGTMKLRANGAT